MEPDQAEQAHMMTVNLEGEVADAGRLHLLRAEWWTRGSRFVVIRYSLAGREPADGLRLDLDKRAVLDSLGDDALDSEIGDRVPQIWQLVAEGRAAAESSRR